MGAKTSDKTDKSQNSVAGVVLFLLSAIFILYLTFPNIIILIDKNISKAEINIIDSRSVSIKFVRNSDGQIFYLHRDLDSRIEKHIKSKGKDINVVYSEHFPESAYLYGVEKDKSIISIVIFLVVSWAFCLIVKNELLGRIK